MGRRGPAREPTALRLLKGETAPSRVNRAAPQPRSTTPVMPSDMTDAANVVWRRVMKEQAPGVILSVDRDGLRIYCEAVARYEESSRLLATSQPLVRGQTGLLVRNPLHQIVRDNADMVKLWARELGLTPAARASLTAPEPGEQASGDDAFFGRLAK